MNNSIIPSNIKNDKSTINKDKIISVWQPLGYSTNHIAKSVGDLFNTKATHTGTLDPMAQGVIIVLTGEERLKRYSLSDLKKTYTFDLVFGISTDSFDALGLITKNNLENVDFDHNVKDLNSLKLQEVCDSFVGEYIQQVPIYSAQLYKGKKLFEYANENIKLPNEALRKKSGTIYDFKVNSVSKKTINTVLKQIIEQINKLSGEFRQQKILDQYNEILLKYDNDFSVYVANLTVTTSKGLYIRTLSQDLCDELNINGFLFNLVRTNNGKYSIKNSTTLIDLFGENYDNILKQM